ncbi:MAG TPA: class I SAM-dependent methyltransferase [Acidobacteriota bacterium]|nr:class I SAM-dependent methyltransferase [Acidobacteriota bacterium]
MHTSHELLKLQAEWLSEARSRILRLAEIGRRRRVLDLGCGSGAILQELQQRCNGSVVALDRQLEALRNLKNAVNGDAIHLPFKNQSFDLIFTQNVFLWIPQFQNVIQEIYRLLKPGGVFVGIEPDYGGMIEFPAEIESQFLWINGLLRAGADPFMGRKLSAVFQNQHWNLRIELLPRLVPPSQDRFKFLEDLPLTSEEQQMLALLKSRSAEIAKEAQLVHLPYFLILAERK